MEKALLAIKLKDKVRSNTIKSKMEYNLNVTQYSKRIK